MYRLCIVAAEGSALLSTGYHGFDRLDSQGLAHLCPGTVALVASFRRSFLCQMERRLKNVHDAHPGLDGKLEVAVKLIRGAEVHRRGSGDLSLHVLV